MKPEKQHLIHDLLDEQHEVRREAVLLAGGRILRRRRWRRVAMRSFAVVAFLGVAALSLQRIVAPKPHILTAVPAPPVQTQGLTDDELLALFPKTPVGLATLENGKKRLIFPRPGDEQRFVINL
jgi:hypothetical protein